MSSDAAKLADMWLGSQYGDEFTREDIEALCWKILNHEQKRADSVVPSSHVHSSALSDRADGEGVRPPDGTTERPLQLDPGRNGVRWSARWGSRKGGDGSQIRCAVIDDDDFTYDAGLYISGDFADQQTAMAYAQEVVDKLNSASEAVCAELAPTTASAPANSETDHPSGPVAWRYKYLGTWHLTDERPDCDAQCVMPLYAESPKAEGESILREALARLVKASDAIYLDNDEADAMDEFAKAMTAAREVLK